MADPTTTPASATPRPAPPRRASRRDPARDPAPDPVRALVRVPGPLRGLVGGADEVPVSAATVGAAVDGVLDRHPALRRHLRTEAGTLREHVNLFLNEDDVRYLEGEGSALRGGDVVTIVPSIAGG